VLRRRHPKTAAATLGNRIKDLRTARGWSQEKLAEHAAIDRSYVAGVEVGARNPSLKMLEKLAKAFGVPISRLFTE
jgi:XRE family transcriptional regulator, regulator of sulfur utilization